MANSPPSIINRMGRSAVSIPPIIIRRPVIGRAPMVVSMAPIGMAIPAVGRAKTKAYAPSIPGIIAY
jgi:hypothetical protein